METYQVKYPLKYQFIGWAGVLIFVPLLCFPWMQKLTAIAIIAMFVLLSVYAVIDGKSTVVMNSKMIAKQGVFGRYGINWDEIKSIEYVVSGDWIGFETIVFEGDGKRLSIAGPRDWSGSKAAETRHCFYSEVRRRGLEIEEKPSAAFRFSKNVRLS